VSGVTDQDTRASGQGDDGFATEETVNDAPGHSHGIPRRCLWFGVKLTVQIAGDFI
jgi:hypothetical protein